MNEAEQQRKNALVKYIQIVEKFLADPKCIESIANRANRNSAIDVPGLVHDIYESLGVPGTHLAPIHLDRYEEMTDADKQMLRDMGIEP